MSGRLPALFEDGRPRKEQDGPGRLPPADGHDPGHSAPQEEQHPKKKSQKEQRIDPSEHRAREAPREHAVEGGEQPDRRTAQHGEDQQQRCDYRQFWP